MLERADAVLAGIALLVASGHAVRAAVAATGVGTGLLTAPLAPAGYLAALVVVYRELVAGPAVDDESRTRS